VIKKTANTERAKTWKAAPRHRPSPANART
jgi:hypothetical protein